MSGPNEVKDILKTLSERGIFVVTKREMAILDAMARADEEELVALVGGELPDTPLWEIAACRAELARREAQR